MTVRLYYDDPTLLRFEARVAEVRDAGGRRAVVLDRTAFYPTSGGQPHDTGVLGETRVVEVLEADDGEVLHVVEGDPGTGVLEGRIDPPRRVDHRQHHTGQHILSRAFEEVLRAPTIGFHLGPEDVDIDLDAPGVDERVLRAAEDLANEIVRGDRTIRIHYAETPEERARFALRKESQREGEIRIIEIDGFDATACGGTHCLTTGEVGLVKVRKWEKVGSRLRIHFLCGGVRSRTMPARTGSWWISRGSSPSTKGASRTPWRARSMRQRVYGRKRALSARSSSPTRRPGSRPARRGSAGRASSRGSSGRRRRRTSPRSPPPCARIRRPRPFWR